MAVLQMLTMAEGTMISTV